jgi:hypothetical protein
MCESHYPRDGGPHFLIDSSMSGVLDVVRALDGFWMAENIVVVHGWGR